MSLAFRAETDANANTFMTFRMGGIAQANLHNNGALSAPVGIFNNLTNQAGTAYTTVLQCVMKPVHTVGYYSLTSGGYTIVHPLSIAFAPLSTSSIIVVQWMITHETTNNAGARIYKDGFTATNGYNTSGTAGVWQTYAAGAYENDVSSTPNTWWIQWHETNSSINPREYQIAVHTTEAAAATFYLNKTAGATNPAAQASYEVGTSHVIAWEILA